MRGLVMCLICSVGAAWAASGAPSLDGHWEGRIATPGPGLAISVSLRTERAGALAGTITIPQQNARDLPLDDVRRQGEEIGFAIPGVPGSPTFAGRLTPDGTGIEGTFRQGGAEFPFSLKRGPDLASRTRTALEGLDGVIESARAGFDVPGLGIAVVRGGEVVMHRGFGLRSVEDELPMTPDTLFAIGSTTKAMTATVLGMLVDEGKLAWDVPVTRYLPEFHLADPMIGMRVTPRDLVTHRTGLPRHDMLWYNNNDLTRDELIDRLAHLELSADLREKFQYNNLMYTTAGHLAARIADTSWEALVDERLFEPLQMSRSNFSVLTSMEDADHALPYRQAKGKTTRIPFRRIDLVGPAGSVNSSVNEMSRWLLFNLASGTAGEQRLISAATLADIHGPHMPTGINPQRAEISEAVYGLGWVVDTYRGHRRVHHSGGIDGFITSVMLFPDDDLGLVAFTNTNSSLPLAVNQTVADRALGLDAIDWIGEAKGERERGLALFETAAAGRSATRFLDTRPSHAVAAYAGDYQHPGYGAFAILFEGDRLSARFNGIVAPLEHWHYDVWSGAEAKGDPALENRKFNFRTDDQGYVAAVTVDFEPSTDPIVFTKRPDARLFDPTYLARFVGRYVLATTGLVGTVELSGTTLRLSVPGQPALTLAPHLSGRFEIAEAKGYAVEFVEEGGAVTGLRVYQPDGVYAAERVSPP